MQKIYLLYCVWQWGIAAQATPGCPYTGCYGKGLEADHWQTSSVEVTGFSCYNLTTMLYALHSCFHLGQGWVSSVAGNNTCDFGEQRFGYLSTWLHDMVISLAHGQIFCVCVWCARLRIVPDNYCFELGGWGGGGAVLSCVKLSNDQNTTMQQVTQVIISSEFRCFFVLPTHSQQLC